MPKFKAFLGVQILMPGVKKLSNVQGYWSSNSGLLLCGVISFVMSRDRVESIHRSMHSADDDTIVSVREDSFVEDIRARCLERWNCNQHIIVDDMRL